MSITETCAVCKQDIISTSDSAPGYGVVDNPASEYYAEHRLQAEDKICYACCGKMDLAYMATHDKMTLYLSKTSGEWTVGNWPGSLKYKVCVSISKRGHFSPIGGYMERRDCWFRDDNGDYWHGRSIGGWTEIAHCRKLKSKRAIDDAKYCTRHVRQRRDV
jgi:hypothetical protein